MAALSTGCCLFSKNSAQNPRKIQERRVASRRSYAISCQIHEQTDDEPRRAEKELKSKEEDERKNQSLVANFLRGDFLKGNSVPKKNGDWTDLTLMSLSFAVYVYISQRIVCAYFLWMSIPLPRQQW